MRTFDYGIDSSGTEVSLGDFMVLQTAQGPCVVRRTSRERTFYDFVAGAAAKTDELVRKTY